MAWADPYVAQFQSDAESLMVDTCTVRYVDPANPTTQDPDTGSEVPAYADRFTSRCKVQSRSLVAQDAEAGGRTVTSVRLELHLPVDTPDALPDDVAEITAAGTGSRTTVGRKFRIRGPVDKTFLTAMRYEVEEIL